MKHQLTKALAELIRHIVEDEECSIYEQYSGRGMYGANCFGITIPRHAGASVVTIIMRVMAEIKNPTWLGKAETEDDLDNEMLEADWKMSSDNLGLDMIYYFPNILWPEEEETEEDDFDESRAGVGDDE